MSGVPGEQGPDDDPVVDLVPVVRRVVGSRVKDPHLAEDLVQETLVRVMAARSQVNGETLVPYAATTARNVVASHLHGQALARRKAHLMLPEQSSASPDESLLHEEEDHIVAEALQRLPASERDLLLAHEVEGHDTRSLAGPESTPGAVAARLSRIRAKLRVEYLLARESVEPAGDICRPVLRAISAADRRRQRELDADGHLLGCEVCARIASELIDRRKLSVHDEVRLRVEVDADVVAARQRGREVAMRLGFSPTEATILATAISEMARNVVKFAARGQIAITETRDGDRHGVTVVVRDVGPGISDLDRAMRDGFSTYHGLGLGLPGARRLMDEFTVKTEPGHGTTVTMTKWRSSGAERTTGRETERDRPERERHMP